MANMEDNNSKAKHDRRIRRLRNLILTTIAAAILIPICICMVLAIKYDRVKYDLDKTTEDLTWYKDHFGIHVESENKDESDTENLDEPEGQEQTEDNTQMEESSTEEDTSDAAANVSSEDSQQSGDTISEADDGVRRVYITFDDGPSESTDEILDILGLYNVKATFFVCGKPQYMDMYKRIVDEGHTIGMHSYSHKYEELYESLDSFQSDMHKLQTFLYENTGVWTTLYRFPGGSSNTVSNVNMNVLIDYLNKDNITYFDWNVASADDKNGITKDIIISNIMNNVEKFNHSVILLHDAADKTATVEALPELIEQIQALDNTVIVPITNETLPVQHNINE
ncbi:MAG: polysaccharide deacetylase family protein [Butyrivibrio sp.]|nr:polysaccharide deacetylase family protein [Butyrivibrio sp.]